MVWYLLNNFIGLIYIFIYFRYIFDNGYDDRHPDIQFQHLLFNDKLEFLCDTWFPIKNQDTFLIRFGYGFFPYKKRILISYGKMHNSVSLKRIIYMETP